MKKCVFILPYFGNYPNYFQLFINSCGKNESFDWFIFTDCNQQLTVPTNVHIFKTSLQEINKRANEKFGFEVSMSNPYKLCDYKPAYGFIFEDLISEYEYWGHCDCDLIFGNLEKLLLPLLNEHYDKLFAAGHLTIYKNDTLNNRVFMSLCNGVELYKRVYNSDKIFVFDEDCGETNNIHSIFLSQSKKVYSTDMSMNMSTSSSRIIREFYDEKIVRGVKKNIFLQNIIGAMEILLEF